VKKTRIKKSLDTVPLRQFLTGEGKGSSQQTQQSVAGQFIGVNLYTYNERRRSVRSGKKVRIFTHADISRGGHLLSLLAADIGRLWRPDGRPLPTVWGIASGELQGVSNEENEAFCLPPPCLHFPIYHGCQ
jgi:hypothetical protein